VGCARSQIPGGKEDGAVLAPLALPVVLAVGGGGGEKGEKGRNRGSVWH